MRRDWLESGLAALAEGTEHEVNNGGEWAIEHHPIPKERVEEAIAELQWEEADGPKPMSPALGIKAVIEECGIPRVRRIAISHELAPWGFYGIEGNYIDGRAQVFVLDCGHDLRPVCVDFTDLDELHEEALALDALAPAPDDDTAGTPDHNRRVS